MMTVSSSHTAEITALSTVQLSGEQMERDILHSCMLYITMYEVCIYVCSTVSEYDNITVVRCGTSLCLEFFGLFRV